MYQTRFCYVIFLMKIGNKLTRVKPVSLPFLSCGAEDGAILLPCSHPETRLRLIRKPATIGREGLYGEDLLCRFRPAVCMPRSFRATLTAAGHHTGTLP